MKLPYLQNIVIENRKLSDYLLNIYHPDGNNKAKFFISKGFETSSLKNILLKQAKSTEVKVKINLEIGVKYIIESDVEPPNGEFFKLRSVWIVYLNEKFVKLVTAYPIK